MLSGEKKRMVLQNNIWSRWRATQGIRLNKANIIIIIIIITIIITFRTGWLPISDMRSWPGRLLFGCLLAVPRPHRIAHWSEVSCRPKFYSFVSARNVHNVSL